MKHELYANDGDIWLKIISEKHPKAQSAISGTIKIPRPHGHITRDLYQALLVQLMPSPVEQAGYKVGQLFSLTSPGYHEIEKGTVLELTDDDGSEAPIFRTPEITEDGTPVLAAVHLNDVELLPEERSDVPSDLNATVDELVTENLRIEREIAQLVSDLKGLKSDYTRNMEDIERQCKPAMNYEMIKATKW